MADCYVPAVINTQQVLVPSGYSPETCPSNGRVMLTGNDWMSMNYGLSNVLNSPFLMSEVQGAQIGGAILLVWAVAFVFRVLARVIYQSSNEREES